MFLNKLIPIFKSSFSKSRICNWLIILCVVYSDYKRQDWSNPDRIIENDINSYYLYLPATFIYDDITLQFADTAEPEVRSKVWYGNSPINKRVGKMSCGLAIMFSPFFFASHLYATLSDYPANGYSVPYRFGLIVGAIFFLGLGLYYLRKTLNLFFPEFITMITCLLIALGTNLYFYATIEPAMSHVFNFALIAAFVYYSICWYTKASIKLTILLGFLLGLITLTRPSNGIVFLFFVFWDVKSFKGFSERIGFLFMKFKSLFLIFLLAFVVWAPQFIYWKITTGNFLYYSYGEKETFFFDNPILIRGLFGYRKGWLLYTPIMAFAIAGIVFLRKKYAPFFLPITLFIVANIYIILSWWCWWYGGSFGARSFIDSYGLMAIPLAALLFISWNKNKILFIGMICVLASLAYLNQFQITQFDHGCLHWDSMTKAAYWNNFGHEYVFGNYQELLEAPNYEEAAKGIR
jgi:hypothetical protein